MDSKEDLVVVVVEVAVEEVANATSVVSLDISPTTAQTAVVQEVLAAEVLTATYVVGPDTMPTSVQAVVTQVAGRAAVDQAAVVLVAQGAQVVGTIRAPAKRQRSADHVRQQSPT